MKTPLIALALMLAATHGSHAQAPQYNVIDLGTLGGGSSYGYGINNSGQVTGYSLTTGDSASHAFLYSGGSMSDLGTLGGSESEGFGINNSGQVTGYSLTTGDSAFHAFLYSGGSMSDLGTLGGTTSNGYGINNSGQVTGLAYTSGGALHAFLYSGGSMSDLGTLGGTFSTGYGINNSGQVTGYSYTTGDSASHAFLYSGGSMSDLGTLGGTYSTGYGINNSGQVTGTANISGNSTSHAFLYSGGSMSDLGTLGGTNSQGIGINNSGQVTGTAYTSGGAEHAFLYSGGSMYDLNNILASNPASVTNIDEGDIGNPINDWGQITAQGTVGGQHHAVLLNPVNPLSSISGNTQDVKFVAGMSYSKMPAFTNTGGHGTTVSLKGGTASQNQDVMVSFTGTTFSGQVSDVLGLSGNAGDTFVLQLSYDKNAAQLQLGGEAATRLMWLDPNSGLWVNAINGNTGGTAQFVNGAYDPNVDFVLGDYGVDTTSGNVWVVVNHNGNFAAVVPEPSTYALLAMGGAGLLALRRRRAKG